MGSSRTRVLLALEGAPVAIRANSAVWSVARGPCVDGRSGGLTGGGERDSLAGGPERGNSVSHDPEPLILQDVADDPLVLRTTFAQFPTGVAALSAVVDGEPVVLVASSFQVGISLEPPLVLFAVQHTSTSWPKLKGAGRIGVSVLGEAHDLVARQLASKAADRFAGIATSTTASGANYVHGAPVWFETSTHSQFPAGDHDVVLLEVHATGSAENTEPLVWHASGFRTLTPRSRG
jgi:flavin reductase (DIM6/NTAB) family NADH-FMN oxidoreductase RutF